MQFDLASFRGRRGELVSSMTRAADALERKLRQSIAARPKSVCEKGKILRAETELAVAAGLRQTDFESGRLAELPARAAHSLQPASEALPIDG